jgi:hypothetical protein
MLPKLKLKIDIEKDIENAQDRFWHKGKYNSPSTWFWPREFLYIKSKNFTDAERAKIVAEQAVFFYRANRAEIKSGLATIREQWGRRQARYYRLINRIFKGFPWPAGDYTGYVSIYNMFPRNIKKKYFFFPYLSARISPTKVIAHEMLHFIFFDYIKKRYGIDQDTKFAGEHQLYVWRVSEVFNDTLENWGPYKKIFKLDKESKPYPGCEKIFRTMKRQWAKSQDIDELLDKWFIIKK